MNYIYFILAAQMNELLVSKACAEKVLREQSGDVVAALEAIISNWLRSPLVVDAAATVCFFYLS